MNDNLEKIRTALLVAVLATGVLYSVYIVIGMKLEVKYSLMSFPYIFLPLGALVRDRYKWIAVASYSIALISLIVFAIVMFSPL